MIAGVLKYNIRKFIVLVIIAKFSRYLVLVLLITNTFASSEYINLGKFKDDNSIFIEKNIDKLSQKFLTTKYVSNTLSNENIDTSKENLIINFEALDCFTFIDTLKALTQSNDLQSFKNNLINTRYKDGLITYQNRNHFFSDWIDSNNMEDITCKIGKCEKSIKYLNKNYKYLKEIPTVKREISYIHPKNIDLSKLKNGDYIGIYTNKEDLDVTHTGIIIKKDEKIFLRHASSLHKKVLDSELFEYTKNKLGILVYRAQ